MDKGLTKIDKAINYAFPSWGARRLQSRLKIQMMTGAYESTRAGKRPFENFLQFITSPNTRANSLERQKIINQSRFLNMTGIGTAYTNRLTTLCIGSGLSFRAGVNAEYLGLNKEQALEKNKELTRLWKLFWNGENGNVDRMYNGGYFQSLAFKSMLDGGDSFILPVKTRPRKNHRFPFAVKCYEAELVSTPHGSVGNNNFVDGIERNDQGVPVRVHIAKSVNNAGMKDSAYFSADNWESREIFGANTGIRQVFQLKNLAQDRPGALRGIPFLAPAVGTIIDHDQFTEEILKTAKAQAVFAGLFKGGKGGGKFGKAPSGNQTAKTTSTFPRIDMSAGLIVDIPDDYTLEAFESTQPRKEFTGFQMHILAVISAITGIPRSFVLMLFDKSYSASKGETSLLWTTVLRNRYAFVFQFLFPFWEYLLSWAVASGNISAPGFFDDPETRMAWLGDPIHQFTGPRMPQLDLEKEAKGLKVLIDSGLKSRRGIIEETSTEDPEQVFTEIEEEQERGIFSAVVNEVANNVVGEETEDEQGDMEDE